MKIKYQQIKAIGLARGNDQFYTNKKKFCKNREQKCKNKKKIVQKKFFCAENKGNF